MDKTIGFLSSLIPNVYNDRLVETYKNMLSNEFEVALLDIFADDSPEICNKYFEEWLYGRDLDAIIINNSIAYLCDVKNLIKMSHNKGAKVYGIIPMEKFDIKNDIGFDRILCPTKTYCRLLRSYGFRKFTYIPYSRNPKDYNIEKKTKELDKFVFLHPDYPDTSGLRTNASAVIEAFKKLSNTYDNIKLIILTTPWREDYYDKNLPNNVEIKYLPAIYSIDTLAFYFNNCDCVVAPSKYSMIEYPIIDAMAFAKPVITTDAPPMNEFVENNTNGLTCACDMKDTQEINIMSAEVDIDDLAKNMETVIRVKEITELMGKNARKLIEDKYNINSNKKIFIDFLKAELS